MPLFAARVSDKTGHPGAIGGPGVPKVLIGGLPAAVAGDKHICAFPGLPPHPPNIFPPGVGSKSVFIGGRPALRIGDFSACGAPIVSGAKNVIIGG